MHKNLSHSTPCELAAVRVHSFFGKDKALLFYFGQLRYRKGEWSKKHTCDLFKTPRISSEVKPGPLHGLFSKRKQGSKARTVTKTAPEEQVSIFIDPSLCCMSQKNANFIAPEKALTSARVGYHRLKEHILASKRLKTLSRQSTSGPKRHEVFKINASNTEEAPLRQEWPQRQEERHFRIERVIKYLSD